MGLILHFLDDFLSIIIYDELNNGYKKGIINYNLHGSYEYTSDFVNSLKVGVVIEEITAFMSL